MKIFNIKYNVIICSILVSISSHLYSQIPKEIGCGTITTAKTLQYFNALKPELKKYEATFSTSKGSQSKSSVVKSSIPIKAHIIRTSNGTGGLSVSELEDAIANVNTLFADALMTFVLAEDIEYIDDNRLYHFHSKDETAMLDAHNVSGVVNIYFTDHIENDADESICGYTQIEKRSDAIIMRNSCSTNDSSLAHELGHFFSLIHTHGISADQLTGELVDGSNCSSEGDQICDTPADPGLTYNNVNNFCRYTGTVTDANGELYHPDTHNIMSYSMKGCRDHFSKQQLARMYAYFQTTKSKYSDSPTNTNVSKTASSISIKAYPNPITDGLIFVKSNNSDEAMTYTISNTMGQVFLNGSVTNQPIDVSRLNSGTYLMTLKNKTSILVKKLVK
ncbi:zinc-dependent metalloprotease [Yeosuana aromativorans]|uniref:zinc-dependent metalloprotease n=1 Tax=Yeosuana aromativorans TaxID=288019 RepID=UPI00166A34D8|nr:zinc-dependent metalloprotease [Yeosuana aromativorans]